MTASETRAYLHKETQRLSRVARKHGLKLRKAKQGFSFGYQLEDAETGVVVYGDAIKGFCRTLPQIDRFLAQRDADKITAPPEKDDAASRLTADSRPKAN